MHPCRQNKTSIFQVSTFNLFDSSEPSRTELFSILHLLFQAPKPTDKLAGLQLYRGSDILLVPYVFLMLHGFSPRLRSQTQLPSVCNDELLDFFNHLLRQNPNFTQLPRIHAQIITTGSQKSAFLASGLVSAYGRYGVLSDARKVFDEMAGESKSNLLLWNSVIRAYVSDGYYTEAVKLYNEMRRASVWGDGFTYPLVIKGFAMSGSLNWARAVHCLALLMGFQHNLHVVNELLVMYGRLGRMDVALQLFERMPARSHISWNMMLSGFAHNFDSYGSLKMFRRMETEGLEPNIITWTSLLSSHARSGLHEDTLALFRELRMRGIGCSSEALAPVLSVCANGDCLCSHGRVIHAFAIKDGFRGHLIVQNALISVYGKNGDLGGAKNMFLEMETKNLESWNSLITSYVKCGFCDEALELLSQMERSSHKPNVITWSALIGGFASSGRAKESLELFQQMVCTKVLPNPVTIANVLKVCAELAALDSGREIHGHVVRTMMDDDLLVGNGLITMYMKCGSLRQGVSTFEKLEKKDLVSWNSIVSGHGMHGNGKQSIELFDRMVKDGLKPDEVTFISVLSACSHSGLVDTGRELYQQMNPKYGIEPSMEHYACMVDLLGRYGFLQEASEMVGFMPFEPNECVWGALLNACRMHRGHSEFAEKIVSSVLSLDKVSFGSYMLLSNIYVDKGRWDDSAKVRVSAKEKGLKKVTGQSWIELKKKVYVFSADNVQESGLEEVYWVLGELALQMKKVANVSTLLLV